MKKLFSFGYGLVDVLASLTLGLLFVLNLFFGTSLIAAENEMVITGNGITFFAWLAFWCVLAVMVITRKKGTECLLDRISPARTFLFCALVYCVAAVYLFVGTDQTHMVFDTNAVFSFARELREGNYESLKPSGYLGRYSYQLGLVMLTGLMQKVCESPLFFRIMNVGFVLGINYTILHLSKKQGMDSRMQRNLTVVASFLIIPQLFSVLFVYGNIPSMLFLLLAVAALIKAFDCGKIRWYAAGVVLLTVSYLLRTNMLIAAIALSLVCLMYFLSSGRKRSVIAAVCLLIIPLMASSGVKTYYRRVSGLEIGQGVPNAAWLVMGMTEGDTMRGWYNGYTDRVYNENGHDGQAAKEQVFHDLIERLYDFKQDIRLVPPFYAEKLISTWCEPTFQTIAIHLLEPEEDCYTPLLQNLFAGGVAFRILHNMLHSLMTVLYLLAALNPLLRRITGMPKDPYTLFALVYFFGGFAFHVLWETKSLYALIYAMVVVPLAVSSLLMLRGILQKSQGKRRFALYKSEKTEYDIVDMKRD